MPYNKQLNNLACLISTGNYQNSIKMPYNKQLNNLSLLDQYRKISDLGLYCQEPVLIFYFNNNYTYYVGLPVCVPQDAPVHVYIETFHYEIHSVHRGVLRDARREPNIIHFYAQGTQHYVLRTRALYHRKSIKKDANIILFDYLVASKAMVGLPVIVHVQFWVSFFLECLVFF